MKELTTRVKLMVDSGAYSAWNRGITIDRKAYGRFLQQNQQHIHVAVNLDVIPGTRGKQPSQHDVISAADQSEANYNYYRDLGLNVLPVYHYGEPSEYLYRIIEGGARYLGLGGIANRSANDRYEWLDQMFRILCDRHGEPQIRVHGFGVTSYEAMHAYPWLSVDSTSWIVSVALGKIAIPCYDAAEERWDYSKPPRIINVTRREEDRDKDMGSGHFDSLGPTTRAMVCRFVKEQGTSMEELAKSQPPRMQLNLHVLLQFVRAWRRRPLISRTSSIFDARPPKIPTPTKSWEKLRFYAGSAPQKEQQRALNNHQHPYRLISYWFLQSCKTLDLARFAATGQLKRK